MTIGTAINKTVAYSKKFKTVISREELETRLVSDQIYSSKKINAYLSNHAIELDNTTNKTLAIKTELAKKMVLDHLIKFRSILMVGITGSVASLHPKTDDDIDLLIITENNRLWWTRFWLRIYVWWNNIPHRRYGKKEGRNEFCFNLWLEKRAIVLPKERQNLRNALDLMMMIPILDRGGYYGQFINKNKWVTKYTATGYERVMSKIRATPNQNQSSNRLLDWLNHFFFRGQYWFMKGKIRGELINKKVAFFHHEDKIDRMTTMKNSFKKKDIWYGLMLMAVFGFGMMIILVSLIRFSLDKTLTDDRRGEIRKKQIEIVILNNGTKKSEFYKLPDFGMLSTDKRYRLKELRDWIWIKITNKAQDKTNLLMLMADKKIAETDYLLKQGQIELAVKAGIEALDKLQYAKSVWENSLDNNPETDQRVYLAGYVYQEILREDIKRLSINNENLNKLIETINQWNETQKIKK